MNIVTRIKCITEFHLFGFGFGEDDHTLTRMALSWSPGESWSLLNASEIWPTTFSLNAISKFYKLDFSVRNIPSFEKIEKSQHLIHLKENYRFPDDDFD